MYTRYILFTHKFTIYIQNIYSEYIFKITQFTKIQNTLSHYTFRRNKISYKSTEHKQSMVLFYFDRLSFTILSKVFLFIERIYNTKCKAMCIKPATKRTFFFFFFLYATVHVEVTNVAADAKLTLWHCFSFPLDIQSRTLANMTGYISAGATLYIGCLLLLRCAWVRMRWNVGIAVVLNLFFWLYVLVVFKG